MNPKLVSTLLGLVIVGAILFYVLEAIQLSDVWDLISSAHKPTLLIFLMCSLSMAFLRSWRYQILLAGSGYSPSLYPLFLITLVRNLFADLLPAKMGTLVYVGLVTSRLRVPLPVALSSWGYEYILDVLALFPIICIALLLSSNTLPAYAHTIFLASLGAIGASIFLVLLLPRMMRLATAVADSILGARFPSITSKLRETGSAVAEMQQRNVLIPVILLSLTIRLLKYTGLYFVLLALLFPLGFAPAALAPATVFFGFISAEFAAALPLPSLAGFGAYQGAWSFTFQLLGFSEHIAKLTSVAHHLFTQAYAYGLGVVAYLLILVYKRDHDFTFRSMTLPTFLLRYIAAVLILGALVTVSFSIAHPRDSDPPPEVAAGMVLPALNGHVVFDSNRSGTFGIYALNPKKSTITPLVDSPAQEMHPHVAPDGKAMAYSWAHSAHRLAAMDVWIVESDTPPRLLIKDGAYPTFSSDGHHIFFQRNRRKIYRFDRFTAEETVIFPKPESPFEGKVITIPRVSPDGAWVSFTSDYPKQWTTWVVNLASGDGITVGNGCQPYWSSDSTAVYFIKEEQSKAGSGIFRFDVQSRTVSEVIDNDGTYGKEYFPFISGDILLWAASSRERHSHIDGGYQLFMRSGSAVVQLTSDKATNRWPVLVGE